MWRETKILLIDDDSARRRDLAVVLNFLGEENLACSSRIGSKWSSRCPRVVKCCAYLSAL